MAVSLVNFERELDTQFGEWEELYEWDSVRRFAELFHRAAFHHDFETLWRCMSARKFPGHR